MDKIITNKPKVISLFSGCGGLDYGFESAGFEIPIANEFNKAIFSTYKANHLNTHLIEGDITKVSTDEIEAILWDEFSLDFNSIDGIIGGPPCQSWSTAGAGRGIDDKKGQLFYQYLRILKAVKPKFFLIENVQGILAPKHRAALDSIVADFDDAGYSIEIVRVNTAQYNVPETRIRVFFVGLLKNSGLQDVFQFPEPSDKLVSLKQAIGDLKNTAIASNGTKHNPDAVNCNEYPVSGFSSRYCGKTRIRGWDKPGYTVLAGGRHQQLHPDSVIPALNDRGLYSTLDGLRRITVREAARIQSFPDEFKLIYDYVDNGYLMVGNAVPPKMGEAIAVSFKNMLKGIKNEQNVTKVNIIKRFDEPKIGKFKHLPIIA